MDLTPQRIAEAFSGHHFALAYPYLLDGIVWNNVGGEFIEGQDAVIHTCEQSAHYLQTVTTTFKKFHIIVGDDTVVVDSLADYMDADQAIITVASCDIYQFKNRQVSEITSYTVEVK